MKKDKFSVVFNKLKNEKKCKYVDISKDTGIASPKLSKFSNPENAVNPSVDDLISLSEYFNVSIDELLGHDQRNNNNNEDYSLSDIIKILFELDENCNMRFCYEHTDTPSNGFDNLPNIGEICITFDDEPIIDFLEEWKKIKNTMHSIKDVGTGNNLYSLWTDSVLASGKSRPKSFGFENLDEMGQRLYEMLMTEYEEWENSKNDGSENLLTGHLWTKEELENVKGFADCIFVPDVEAYKRAISLAESRLETT